MYFTLDCIQGTTLCSVFFCPTEPTGVTQKGVNTGASSSFYDSLMPRPLLRCLPTYIFIARRLQPSLSLVDNEVEFCILPKLFIVLPLSTTRYESEKKNTLAQI